MPEYTRREFIKVVTATTFLSSILTAGNIGCSPGVPKRTKDKFTKVILLGIDGLSPDIMEIGMARGDLPNFAKLKATGSYRHLATINPAQSPVVWSSIATGNNPGYHSIFDFIVRNPRNYLPELSLTKMNPKNITGRKESMFLQARQGKAFWQITSDNNIPTTVIRWPITFPAEKISGNMLAGLGVPDIKGNLGRYAFYTTNKEKSKKVKKGDVKLINFRDGVAETTVNGPAVAKFRRAKEAEIPMNIRLDKKNARITISVNGSDYEVKEGGWSDWMRLVFDVGIRKRAPGMVRCYLAKMEPDLELYMTPVQVDAKEPIFPISHPDEYAGELAESIGYYHTLGMPEDTNAFGDDCLSADAFLESCDLIMREREGMFWTEINRFKDGVLAFVFDTTDRIQHAFWSTRDRQHPIHDETFATKYGGVIFDYYQRMDNVLGELWAYVDETTALFVVSDHGFTTFRRAFHVNSWLAQNGFMTLQGTPTDEEGDPLFKNVNWERTKAYALGFSSVYINKKGRERKGIVREGTEEAEVKGEISEGLKKFREPNSGQIIIKNVYDGKKLYRGPHADDSPDLILGFAPGYRASWQTAIGGAPESLVEDNKKRWSGDHLVDAHDVAGIFFTNQKIQNPNPTILDIAPTVLQCFGIKAEEMEGRDLL